MTAGVAAHTGARRTGLAVPFVAAAVALAALIGLGVWQLERLAWKDALLATMTERLAAPPVALPPPAAWARLSPADEFLRVTMTAAFALGREALVFTGGSTMRQDGGGPGYWVFAPARLADGTIVMVNRGFVPEGRQDPASRSAGAIDGPMAMAGVLRWPEAPGLFTPAADVARHLWFVRDSAAIAAALSINAAPFYVELESPAPPGGLPHPARVVANLPNNHLQYALTWFGLAAVLVGVFTAWVISGRHAVRAG
jgi:surfeit locus 1 family protein